MEFLVGFCLFVCFLNADSSERCTLLYFSFSLLVPGMGAWWLVLWRHLWPCNDLHSGSHTVRIAEPKDGRSLGSLEGTARGPPFQSSTVCSFLWEKTKSLSCLSHYYLDFLLQGAEKPVSPKWYTCILSKVFKQDLGISLLNCQDSRLSEKDFPLCPSWLKSY